MPACIKTDVTSALRRTRRSRRRCSGSPSTKQLCNEAKLCRGGDLGSSGITHLHRKPLRTEAWNLRRRIPQTSAGDRRRARRDVRLRASSLGWTPPLKTSSHLRPSDKRGIGYSKARLSVGGRKRSGLISRERPLRTAGYVAKNTAANRKGIGTAVGRLLRVARRTKKVWPKANNSARNRVNSMVIRANHSCGPGTHGSNGISSRTRNDVESTANGQRAGGPLHLKGLTSRTDVPQSCASMTQEKI